MEVAHTFETREIADFVKWHSLDCSADAFMEMLKAGKLSPKRLYF